MGFGDMGMRSFWRGVGSVLNLWGEPIKPINDNEIRLGDFNDDAHALSEDWNHVPFTPAGHINVKFLEPTPTVPLKIEIEDDDE